MVDAKPETPGRGYDLETLPTQRRIHLAPQAKSERRKPTRDGTRPGERRQSKADPTNT